MPTTSTTSPPTADELSWEALRTGVVTLEPEQREIFETVADHVADLWPEDVDANEIRENAKEDALTSLGAELADVLGIDIDRCPEDLPEQPAEFVDAIQKAVEHARAEGEKDATIPSRANTAERKAMRLLLERRLVVTRFDKEGPYAGLIVAHCKGDSGTTYSLGYDPRGNGTWRCTCQEMKGQCSHLAALKMVTPA